jgi:hypothetical protein
MSEQTHLTMRIRGEENHVGCLAEIGQVIELHIKDIIAGVTDYLED